MPQPGPAWADVVVMNDNLQRVAETVRLSRPPHAILWQNITLTLGIKSVFLLLAVVADMGASLLVVANGLRLLSSASLHTLGPTLSPSHPPGSCHVH